MSEVVSDLSLNFREAFKFFDKFVDLLRNVCNFNHPDNF